MNEKMNAFSAIFINKGRNKIYVFILMISISIIGLIAWLMSRSLDEDQDAVNLARTQALLKLCDNALKTWIDENGRIPEESEGISVLELGKFPPRDAWGNALVYKRNNNSLLSYSFYSIGPNAIDENGDGDDVHAH
ncbi:hypothetical protein ACO0LL_24450 [Undibacterium sp. TC4M20W]|uniref:hypothetical protein n=1 Tax=Undibacterium sp. TC4M20W TaxID=3413052 RepID=UPI003BF17A26